jgi:hypothetical protein
VTFLKRFQINLTLPKGGSDVKVIITLSTFTSFLTTIMISTFWAKMKHVATREVEERNP